ncbi:DMT family transporter [Brevibacterium jeotgali]|uniref:Quaternary ammonium compound-resistance protein SugE n=1 Tax=Brevibacterium jeotgali TaxID=1262550 RepID=A0A2H1L7T9_9MICO|nr:multidrug efflux SMR transporter [Brevibacterium jeotgali]TWC03315.1 quaternary ammonium compound-resistance protein SugE [Brevibacterium jeotgali]SMY12974.1 quaternary ammonium compound-resistance protein SugE [Brevibacterium jeotgali]
MHWILLILSGSLEAVWAHALADIFDPVHAIVFLLGLTGSVWGLQRAMKVIPMGTAYAIWVGVGASVTAIWSGIQGEPFGPAKILFLTLIMVGVIGLELSRGKEHEESEEAAESEKRAPEDTPGPSRPTR